MRGLPFGIAVALVVFNVGCSDKKPKVDESLAYDVMERFLVAWKSGKPSSSLTTEVPPIYASDPDWDSGMRLVSYEHQGSRPRSGAMEFDVQLTLQDPAAKETKANITYVVRTSPRASVERKLGFD